YTRKPWKRVIVMFAGPFMNLILAVAIFMGVAMTFGFQTQTTEVAGVQQCVISQSDKRETCKDGDPVSPAKAAGLQEGDRIVAFDGKKVDDWATLSDRIRDTIGPATIVVERDGEEVTLNAVLRENAVAKKDGNGQVIPDQFIKAGYLGFAAQTEIVPLSFGESTVR
ncbi:site-2 protease family protein, partial [Streptomyces sp. SID7499]|nr:site-2 protease family protein [Streptomyces sp. SID7499]